MTTRLTLLCVPATAALRAGRFPADESLDPGQADDVARLATALGAPDQVLSSPARCAREAAMALGHSPIIEPALGEVDYGRWLGRSLKEIGIAEPAALSAWLSDPDMVAHGGESLSAFCERVRRWMGPYASPASHTLVVTHASVIKAIVLHALEAPVRTYWQIDVAPLSTLTLSRQQDRWRLSLGESLRFHQ